MPSASGPESLWGGVVNQFNSISKFNLWLLKKIAKKIVVQGFNHKENIVKYYQIMFDAAEAEFTEDNPPTIKAFLEECFHTREQIQKKASKMTPKPIT